MNADDETAVDVFLDAPERRRVATPLLPEFAIVSTMVLIAAPIVLVGATAFVALRKRTRRELTRRTTQEAEGATRGVPGS